MENRGELPDKRAKGRPAIGRRSCDQCRSRKVGCDRASPCSLCIAAKLQCTFSTVATHAIAPKQRVLISTQYEQKIDGIARDIDGIKALLEGLSITSNDATSETISAVCLDSAGLYNPAEERKLVSDCGASQWDHSGNIVDFVKTVVSDRASTYVDHESSEVLSSLKSLVQALEDPSPARSSCLPSNHNAAAPPLEEVLGILRWAKDHTDFAKTPWIPEILPRQRFTEICQKVFFSVDEFSDIESILANGYLSYTFFEHIAISGRQDYLEYVKSCRKNFEVQLEHLPLLLPANIDTIAALTLGVVNAVENSNTTKAWTFISAASSLCQTLGYHRSQSSKQIGESTSAAQERLFWTVYTLEKGLSFRLGRSSTLRDDEITAPVDLSDENVSLARIQSRIYDQLYSAAGLSRSIDEREALARTIAADLRAIIDQTRVNLAVFAGQASGSSSDQTRLIYLRSKLVCQSSLLAQVLRAMPHPQPQTSTGGTDDCIKAARDCLDLHDECMTTILECKNDPFMMKRYINWAILHTPFIPFNLLFTRAVQLSDAVELDRLDRFAASLRPDSSSDSATHPHRLYHLLCQAARLYFNMNQPFSEMGTFNEGPSQLGGAFDFAHYGTSAAGGEATVTGNELSQWYYENQQIMSLLNDNVLF